MKVYTKIVYDKDDNIIEEHSYNYNGPVSQAGKPTKFNTKASKVPDNLTKVITYENVRTGFRQFAKKQIRPDGWKPGDGPWTMESGTNGGESSDHPDSGAQFGPSYDNPLHKFASYNTLFTLSGLRAEEMDSLDFLKNPPHDIIARSGGIGDPNVSNERYDERKADRTHRKKYAYRHGETINEKYDQMPSFNILSAGHDIFFEDVNIISTVGPNPERGLANFTKMEFQLHEPYGITLVEKIRSACWVNDYDDYQDAPLLLTIQWKGWDENGKDKIIPGGANMLTRKVPILISRVQFDVDEGGARYQIIAVPYNDLAQDDRYKFPRTLLSLTASEMVAPDVTRNKRRPGGSMESVSVTSNAGWVGKMENLLDKQMEDEIEEGVRQEPDYYRFIVHPDVLTYGKKWLKDLQLAHHEEHRHWFKKFAQYDTQPTITINDSETSGDLGTSLPKLFEDAIRTLVGYSQLVERFWYTWGSNRLKEAGGGTGYEATIEYYKNRDGKFRKDLEKHQYVDWFMIKPSVHTNTDKFDHIRKVHQKTITYYATPTKIHILKFVKPGVSFGNTDWNKYVKKQYDYIYTGNNVDVQSLKIDYKTAYYMRNVRPYWKTNASKGKYENFVEGFNDVISKVFGQEKYPEINLPLRQEPSHIKGRSAVSTSSPQAKTQEFYDYLTNPQADMMKIELEILGDPQFICQDLYTPLKKTGDNIYKSGFQGTYSSVWGSFNAEQYQPLVKVNYRLPDEINLEGEGAGVMFEKQLSYSESLFFNGVYQVTKVESRINQGQFTQVLSLVRLNNQKGAGETALTSVYATEAKKILDAEEAAEALAAKLEQFCFHPEQLVGDKFMKDLQPGDDINGKEILGMMKLRLTGDMYSISNVRVTGSHGMKYKNEWIFVADHPDSIKIDDKPEFVYIPLVETGTFTINNEEFADYDYHDMIVLGDKEWKRRRGFQKVAQQEELTGAIN